MRIAILFLFAVAHASALAAAAGPLVPTKPSEVVTLAFSGTVCASSSVALDQRVLPDGTTVPFAIPEGRVLVVTEVDWQIDGNTPSVTMTFELRALTPAATATTFFTDFATSNAEGDAGNVRPVANAIVGTALCARGSTGVQEAYVRGFLAKDK
jgi:hypothetical protein